MNLQEAITAELPFLRAQAEARMTLTLQAYSPASWSPTVPGDGGYLELAFTDEGTTPGRVQGGSAGHSDTATRSVDVAGTSRSVLSGGLHIPLGAPVPTAGEQRGVGWEYVITAVGPLGDPALLGRRFLVVGVPAKSHATARRLDVVEV